MKKRGTVKTIVITVTVAAAFVTMSFGRELYNNYQVDQEISRLKEKTAALQAEKFSILSLKEQFSSQDFLEGEARIKMGLKKPGETAMIIPETQEEEVVTSGFANSLEPKEESNFRKWWNYFFD